MDRRVIDMLSIDEAIAHAREVAEIHRKDNDNCKYKSQYGCKDCADYYSKPCIECAEEQEQLAELLEELKARREADRTSDSKPFDVLLVQRYNKAIDDAKDVILQTLDNEILVDTLHLRLEQLKAGKENEQKK